MVKVADIEVPPRTLRENETDEDMVRRDISIIVPPDLAARLDVPRLSDDQSVLLWQACAYAQDLIDAIESNHDADTARRALLRFIHDNMLPYLRFEESEVTDWTVPDARLRRLQIADHDRIRLAADDIEASATHSELTLAAQSLVDCLSRHILQEQACIIDSGLADRMPKPGAPTWAPPLLTDRIDLDGLSADDRDVLVLDRLQRMRPGDVVRLRASADLHGLWCRQHARSPDTHVWVYEQTGPRDWLVRVTRREAD